MHIPVLKEESIKLWKGKALPGIYIDGTFGEGGHSKYLLETAKETKVLGIDRDPKRVEKAKNAFSTFIYKKRLSIHQGNFEDLAEIYKSWKKKQKTKKIPVRGVLLDLGMCSTQLEEGRGLSFARHEEPLDMRLGEGELQAKDILNDWSEEKIYTILKGRGEERFARTIAKSIVKKRKEAKFQKVGDLVSLLGEKISKNYRKQKIHFATRTFQALRMTVNQEEENLKKGLEEALKILEKGGVIVIISFHSGEDRIVKNFFRVHSKDCVCPPESPICRCDHEKTLKRLTTHPIKPNEDEIKKNPRARSAKLRAAIKIN